MAMAGGSGAPARAALAAEFEHLLVAARDALQREDPTGARDGAAAAVRIALRLGDRPREGRARLVYGRAIGFNGSLTRGLSQLDRAEPLVDPADLGVLFVERS